MSEPFLALFKHQHDHHSEYAMVYRQLCYS